MCQKHAVEIFVEAKKSWGDDDDDDDDDSQNNILDLLGSIPVASASDRV